MATFSDKEQGPFAELRAETGCELSIESALVLPPSLRVK
jgi:hypothetical protein